MAGRAALARARKRIEGVSTAALTSRDFRIGVLDALRDAVGFDSYVWLMTDPRTCVGAGPLADVPSLGDLPTLIRLKYLTDVNRWTTIGDSGVVSLRAATEGVLERSLLWRELLHSYGVADVLSAVFADRWGCWAFLDLWRDRPFDDAELELLAGLRTTVTTALRRCVAATFAQAAPSARVGVGPAVLLLSPTLDVRAQTGHTQEYLRRLVPRDDGGPPVPAGAYNVAGQLLAIEAGVDAHPPRARVALDGGLWLTMSAARIETESAQRRDIAITIEPATPADRADVFACAHALTRRETEVLDLVASGKDTRSIARRLVVSETTVNDHIKSVFAKAAVGSRGELLARVAGSWTGVRTGP